MSPAYDRSFGGALGGRGSRLEHCGRCRRATGLRASPEPSTIGALDIAVDFGDWAVQDASRRQRRRCHRGGSGRRSAALPRPLGRRAHGHLRSLGRRREDRADHEEAREGMTGGRRPPTWLAVPTQALRERKPLDTLIRRGRDRHDELSDGWPGAGMVCAILAAAQRKLALQVESCSPRLLRLARPSASGDCGLSAGVLAAGPVTTP